ncbi:acyltransferase family protein [Ornithinimicrobium cavernae]|uniref:acyltransferase family protein n=1 Tax=Ornithinimicrobium cavernae TaxID=2666047 RepID=UPI000D6956D4|nr:acyltransferase family protein [Ornithinimicrobium cavernae]
MTAATATPATGERVTGSRFRKDVEGLRAVAVLLVLAYHAGVPWLSGGFIGVDVFFVVSGFVITNQLVREVEATGRVHLLGFYGRRAKRLLPASALVLVVTAVASWLLTSRVQWQSIGGDIAGSAVYLVNWVFAARSVDYLAEDVEPSPVLHFWSLAVEEQFYLLWPLVLIGLVLLLRRRARRSGARGASGAAVSRRSLAAGLLAVIVVPSLVFSVVFTALQPAAAFFVTPTRLWELGAGALVALGAGTFGRWRQRTGALVAWVGLLVLAASSVAVTSSTPWPGAAALAPVLGTAAIIAGGFSCRRMGVAGLLGLRPLVWVGGLSYSLYLWHWPLLRFWEWELGTPSAVQGLVVVAFSFLPAWLSYRYVESPIRHARALNLSPRYALSVGVNATLVALVAGLALGQGGTLGPSAAARPTGATWSGSAAGDGASPPDADPSGPSLAGEVVALPHPSSEKPGDEPFFDRVTPDPASATSDLPALYDLDCASEVTDATVRMCERGAADGDVVVAVVGDSKVGQWLPALEEIAADRGWLLRVYTKSGCTFTAATIVLPETGEPFTSCRTWSDEVFQRITGPELPDVVVTSGLRGEALDASGEVTEDAMVEGYTAYWTALGAEEVPVIAISDSPQPRGEVRSYQCVADAPDDVASCDWPAGDGSGSPALRAAAQQVDTAEYVDMNPWVCPEGTCPAVYRNVLTYRQGSHITATFAEVLSEPLAGYLVPLVEGAGPSGDPETSPGR